MHYGFVRTVLGTIFLVFIVPGAMAQANAVNNIEQVQQLRQQALESQLKPAPKDISLLQSVSAAGELNLPTESQCFFIKKLS